MLTQSLSLLSSRAGELTHAWLSHFCMYTPLTRAQSHNQLCFVVSEQKRYLANNATHGMPHLGQTLLSLHAASICDFVASAHILVCNSTAHACVSVTLLFRLHALLDWPGPGSILCHLQLLLAQCYAHLALVVIYH